MGERADIFLEKAVYYPGDVVNGRVDCHFLYENKVTAIKVRIKGKAKVYWKEGRNSSYNAEECYFEVESDLLTKETTFPPGVYGYPFSFPLKIDIPASMNGDKGSITYSVKCKIDRPWAIDHTSKKIFQVHTYNDLNKMHEVKIPYQLCEKVTPKFLFISEASGPITIQVNLPVTGFVPSQMIPFSANLRNDSGTTVEKVHFQLVQGFTFYADGNSTTSDSFLGQEFAITDSTVPSGNQKSWDLELRVPLDMFNQSLQLCRIIKVFWNLKVFNDEANLNDALKNYIKSVSENLDLDVAIILTRNKYYADGTLQQVDTVAFSSAQENNNFNISTISGKNIDKIQEDAEDKGVLISLSQESFLEENSTTKNFHTEKKEVPDSVAAAVAAAGKDGFEIGLVEEVANTFDMTVTSGTVELLEYFENGKIRRNRTSTLYPRKVVILGAEKMSARMQQSAEALMKKAYKIDIDDRAPIIVDLFDKKFPKYYWQVLVNATHYRLANHDSQLTLKVGSDVYNIIGILNEESEEEE